MNDGYGPIIVLVSFEMTEQFVPQSVNHRKKMFLKHFLPLLSFYDLKKSGLNLQQF